MQESKKRKSLSLGEEEFVNVNCILQSNLYHIDAGIRYDQFDWRENNDTKMADIARQQWYGRVCFQSGAFEST